MTTDFALSPICLFLSIFQLLVTKENRLICRLISAKLVSKTAEIE